MSYTDAELLDFLEREANASPLLLHDGSPKQQFLGHRGLGLKGTGRSLREALTDMMGERPGKKQ